MNEVDISPWRIEVARSFLSRLRGWLWHGEPKRHEALLIVPCDAVHGIGLRHSLDVLFLDAEACVIEKAQLDPYRIVRCAGAQAVLEMRAGQSREADIDTGTMLPYLRKLIGRRE